MEDSARARPPAAEFDPYYGRYIERIFGARALCIARGEAQPLPGFDENASAEQAGHAAHHLQVLRERYLAAQ